MMDDLELLREEMELALGGLDSHQTQLRPMGLHEKWTIQQIVGHLLRTYTSTKKLMDVRLEKGLPSKARVGMPQRVGQFVLLRLEYFPHGRAAPEAVSPLACEVAVPSGILLEQTRVSLAAMDKSLAACGYLFGGKRRAVSHVVLGPLSIRQWSKFHLVHGRHHMKQIASIRKQHGV